MRVYDTSGPYTDPEAKIDLRRGLPELRKPWILERGEYDVLAPSYRPVPGILIRALRSRQAGRFCAAAAPSLKCIMPEKESSLLKWNLSPCAKD